jgi:single-stranded-DNA-specific exonuclease
LGLADELERLEPCGMGNPSPRLLVPGARFDDVRPMGEGRHARFSVSSGGVRARAVAFGCDGRVTDDPDRPLDATFRLERNAWNGAVEPRLVLRHAQPCAPAPIGALPAPDRYLDAVLAEVDASLAPAPGPAPGSGAARVVVDCRGHSPLAVLVDAVAGGEPVLALCADVARRLQGLSDRVGGFTLAAYAELERDPSPALAYAHVVALDPPAGPGGERALRSGEGIASLAWGEPEVRFARQLLEHEYALRDALVSVFRGLRASERAEGPELERLLRGDGAPGRSARLAGRLVRVLSELALVRLERDPPSLAILDHAPTELQRSAAFRFYSQVYEDGQRYLNSANHRAGA